MLPPYIFSINGYFLMYTHTCTPVVDLELIEPVNLVKQPSPSRSEESSGTSSTSSTPPQKRKDEEKATPIMSVFQPAARPTPKNKVLNPPSSHQTLWSSNRKKETSAPTTTAAASTTATATATESIPKAKGIVA